MMAVIQIPCYNEEQTLGITLSELPSELPGVDRVEWLVIDDGSTDATVEVARKHGVRHIVRHTHNRGLAAAFVTGLKAAIALGADIIVNTDADHQYKSSDMARLMAPIVEGRADMVIGARPISEIKHFSLGKKLLQWLGSWTVRQFSGTEVADATSGFRALSREAAKRTFVYSRYTYTLETIIQAGFHNMRILSVPIGVNGDLRPSRLVTSIGSYVSQSALTILSTYLIYRPLRFFSWCALVVGLPGLLLLARFFFYYFTGQGQGYIQSVVIGSALLAIAFVFLIAGLITQSNATTRRFLEEVNLELQSIKEKV